MLKAFWIFFVTRWATINYNLTGKPFSPGSPLGPGAPWEKRRISFALKLEAVEKFRAAEKNEKNIQFINCASHGLCASIVAAHGGLPQHNQYDVLMFPSKTYKAE